MKGYKQNIYALFSLPLYTSDGVRHKENFDELKIGEILDDFPKNKAQSAIRQIQKIALISQELAYLFLFKLSKNRWLLEKYDLTQIVSEVLDDYDAHGMSSARQAVECLEKQWQASKKLIGEISLQDVHRILSLYLCGLGLEDIKLVEAEAHYTDTVTIFLPRRLVLFSDAASNFLLYKMMVTHKFAQIKLGSYQHLLEAANCPDDRTKPYKNPANNHISRTPFVRQLNQFQESKLARDLFMLIDTVRVETWMAATLPGLFDRLKVLKKALSTMRVNSLNLSPKNAIMEYLIQGLLTQAPIRMGNSPWAKEVKFANDLLMKAQELGIYPADRATDILGSIYRILEKVPGSYQSLNPVPYIGELKPEEFKRFAAKRQIPAGQTRNETDENHEDDIKKVSSEQRGDWWEETKGDEIGRRYLTIQDEEVAFKLSRPKDKAKVPDDYRSRPSKASKGVVKFSPSDPISAQSIRQASECSMWQSVDGAIVIDEWDYRRQSYRKSWVRLKEIDILPGDLNFAEKTLSRYKWMAKSFKDQFERIRLKDHLRRRQKDGDNIDIDAAVETLCDIKAGICPSENVYKRLGRIERDICATLLIDLSGSTEGLINHIERVALLVICEALQGLKDRFAIYGFSGQTRKCCELFKIKGLDEAYGETVKSRIANLYPRHCTRLGPPIRYLSALLRSCEAKSKLLMILSDGKPYDYDGYMGEYGIEDTRQAILEARRADILPFCITVDKSEHSYLSHMYGPNNYVFVDDIAKLPQKIPQFYGSLTA